MTGLRTFAEIAIGLLFSAGAIFNSVYTLRHSDEFYGSFADGAWLNPARWFVEEVVIPNARVFTVLLILFQVAVAAMILTRGDLVGTALVAGAAFAALAALASSPGGTIANLVLAAVQVALAASR